MTNESRKDNGSLQGPTTKTKSESKKKSESATETGRKNTRRVSTGRSTKSADAGTGDSVSEKPKSTNRKSKKAEQSSLEISDSKSENKSDNKPDNGPSNSKRKASERPKYLDLKFSSVSKKLETSLIKFISENKETQRYLNLSFSSSSILRILDSKDSEYFINLDNEYMMVNLKESSVKNYGDIFECGIDTMMNIPWEENE